MEEEIGTQFVSAGIVVDDYKRVFDLYWKHLQEFKISSIYGKNELTNVAFQLLKILLAAKKYLQFRIVVAVLSEKIRPKIICEMQISVRCYGNKLCSVSVSEYIDDAHFPHDYSVYLGCYTSNELSNLGFENFKGVITSPICHARTRRNGRKLYIWSPWMDCW